MTSNESIAVSVGNVVDLFAGAGGWDVGARLAELDDPIGVEIDAAACDTRRLNNLPTIESDVTKLDAHDHLGAEGLIASPPCQDWSSAGRRSSKMRGIDGDSGHLVAEVMRWAETIRPRWVACEQVRGALPVWVEYAIALERLGYRTWTGLLNSADYGVPQTRRRAVLLAHRDRVVGPPDPTHQQSTTDLGMFDLLPWETMRSVIKSPSIVAVDRRQQNPDGSDVPVVSVDRPAPTLDTQIGMKWLLLDEHGQRVRKLTVEEAAALQSFPHDFAWAGRPVEQFMQIGNAVPPLLASRLLRMLCV